jgi:hypothetical protein
MEVLKHMSENGMLWSTSESKRGEYWEARKTELHMLFTKYYQGDKIGEVAMNETHGTLERQEMCR